MENLTLESQLETLENEVIELRKQIDPVLNQIYNKNKQIEKVKQELNNQVFENLGELTIGKILSLPEENFTNEVTFKRQEFFKHKKGIYLSGYNIKNNQSVVKICFDRKENKEEQFENVRQVIEANRPYELSNRLGRMCKVVPIFERTLSENGVLRLVLDEGKILLTKTSHHKENTEKEFTLIDDALDYIFKNHYYK